MLHNNHNTHSVNIKTGRIWTRKKRPTSAESKELCDETERKGRRRVRE